MSAEFNKCKRKHPIVDGVFWVDYAGSVKVYKNKFIWCPARLFVYLNISI